MVSVSSQFLKQMFTSAGYGISLSPGTLKRKQNPSLLIGKIEQSYRTKHQPISSDLISLLLYYSWVNKCVCVRKLRLQINIKVVCGMSDYGDVMMRWCLKQQQLNGGRLRQFLRYLFGAKARCQLSLGPLTCFLNRVSLLLKWGCLTITDSCVSLWMKG